MRRQLSIATFVLLLASMPVAAQHGAVHAGGGHAGFSGGHAGFGGGHGGGFSGGHISGGMRSGGMGSGPGTSRGFSHGPSFSQRSFQQRASSNRPFMHDGFRRHRGRDRDFGFRNNCYGYGCRGRYYYPYAYSGFYDPYWWWDSNSSGYQNYDEDYERNRAVANEMNQQSLEEQRMRRQDQDNDQDSYDRDPYARLAPVPRDPESDAAQPATLLVFRNQHRQEVRNYAIVGQTLWSFGSPRTEKIPLADLDLAATTRVNEERGLTFRLPAPNQAQ